MIARLAAAIRLLLLAGCINLHATYDEAARRHCERQINTDDRLACQHDAETSARERRDARRQD